MEKKSDSLKTTLREAFDILDNALESHRTGLEIREVGTVDFVGSGVVRVKGLRGVRSEELLRFPGDLLGMAFDVGPQETGVVLLDQGEELEAGDEVRRTDRVLDIPVGRK